MQVTNYHMLMNFKLQWQSSDKSNSIAVLYKNSKHIFDKFKHIFCFDKFYTTYKLSNYHIVMNFNSE
jgi:hypothetical protein